MTKRMLIDANHPEEMRVVVTDGNRLEEFDFETSTKKQLKGNIYLAKVTRVEPSLQAAFVDYGGNRNGFLAFSEIHPDYYQIPVADREALLQESEEAEGGDGDASDGGENGEEGEVEEIGGSDVDDIDAAVATRRKSAGRRRYKIQEVIRKRQLILVQVVKEERGTKGAALTSYISLAGRYCVLMPNTTSGGGISRKISDARTRKKLRDILSDLEVPEGMSVVLRTAGAQRTKPEIKRDFEYLLRLWDNIRETTLESRAPALIYEEADIIKRSVRDLYTNDIDEVLVEGEEGYRAAKDFMKMLMPSRARMVKSYRDHIPLFHRYQVETQLASMHNANVRLPSGGYVVINQTEALVAIDVNSGRSTKERNVEETAYKTNLEAADEIARQLRLRDLAGLIVIDFIDMDDRKNNRNVERRLKEAMKADRARIQVGRISSFGLMELSRQRLRPSLIEASTQPCPTCGGTGLVRSVESTALTILRAIEEEGIRDRSAEVTVKVPTEVALYILNQKRDHLIEIEQRYGLSVVVDHDDTLVPPRFTLERTKARTAEEREEGRAPETFGGEGARMPEAEEERDTADAEVPSAEAAGEEEEERSKRKSKRRRRRRKRKPEEAAVEATAPEPTEEAKPTEAEAALAEAPAEAQAESGPEAETEAEAEAEAEAETPKPKRRRRRRPSKAETTEETPAEPAVTAPPKAEEAPAEAAVAEEEAEAPKPKRRRTRRPAKAAAVEEAPAEAAVTAEAKAEEAPAETAVAEEETEAPKPKRRRRRRPTKAEAEAETATSEAPVEEPAEAAPAKAEEAEEAKPKARPKRRRRKTETAEPKAKEVKVIEITEAKEEKAKAEEGETPVKKPRRGWWAR